MADARIPQLSFAAGRCLKMRSVVLFISVSASFDTANLKESGDKSPHSKEMTCSRIRENSEGAMIQTEVSRLRLRENISITPARSISSAANTVLQRFREPGRLSIEESDPNCGRKFTESSSLLRSIGLSGDCQKSFPFSAAEFHEQLGCHPCL